jgi:hypothetical protein
MVVDSVQRLVLLDVFIIHGSLKNTMTLSFVYILTPNRTSRAYDAVFDALHTMKEGLDPQTVMSYYENTLQKSVKKSFHSKFHTIFSEHNFQIVVLG